MWVIVTFYVVFEAVSSHFLIACRGSAEPGAKFVSFTEMGQGNGPHGRRYRGMTFLAVNCALTSRCRGLFVSGLIVLGLYWE